MGHDQSTPGYDVPGTHFDRNCCNRYSFKLIFVSYCGDKCDHYIVGQVVQNIALSFIISSSESPPPLQGTIASMC